MKSLITLGAQFLRLMTLAILLIGTGVGSVALLADGVSSRAEAAVVNSISVRGNQRVDDATIKSYLTVEPGKSFSSFDSDESLRKLFATGLFSDVNISQSGRVLIVTVDEHPTVNLVLFEGNKKVKDDQLKNITQLQSLSVFNPETADREELLERVTGRTGNLRAPALRRGNVFYIGYNEELYETLIKE